MQYKSPLNDLRQVEAEYIETFFILEKLANHKTKF